MEWSEIWWKERTSLGLNIPPLQGFCMSPCNYSMYSDTSARTSKPLILIFLIVNGLLGFLMTNLNLKFVSALLNLLFFFFNLSLALCNFFICRDRVVFISPLSLTYSLKISFSFLICLLSTSNSYLSLLSISIADFGGLGVLSLLSEALFSSVST